MNMCIPVPEDGGLVSRVSGHLRSDVMKAYGFRVIGMVSTIPGSTRNRTSTTGT